MVKIEGISKQLAVMVGNRGRITPIRVLGTNQVGDLIDKYTAYISFDPGQKLFNVRIIDPSSNKIVHFTANQYDGLLGYDSTIPRKGNETDIPAFPEPVRDFRMPFMPDGLASKGANDAAQFVREISGQFGKEPRSR